MRRRYASIAESGALVGSIQVRNLATLGGNICNAAPSADMAPPLLSLDAEAVITGPKGQRRVPMRRSSPACAGPCSGRRSSSSSCSCPRPGPRSGGSYIRHTPRRELDIAVVGVASQVTLQNGMCTKARIALAAVAPTPVRATAAEQALEGQALTPARDRASGRAGRGAAQPISDQRGSAEFRRHLVRVLTRRTLTRALERAGS